MIALKDLSQLCDLHGPLKMIHCLKDDDGVPQYLLTGLLKRNRDEDTVWWPLNADELLEGLENKENKDEEDEGRIFVYIAYEVNDTMSEFFGSEDDDSYKSCLLTPTFERQTNGKWFNCGTRTDYNDDWTCRQILIENISQGLLTDLVVVMVGETGEELWKDQTPGVPEHMTIKLYFRGDDEYAIICDDFLQEQNP